MTQDKDQMRAEFESWWESAGQFCRAGGGDYEKTFAFRGYEAGRASAPQGVPDGWRERFKESLYERFCALDNQDYPLEDYPNVALEVLDQIVGPRHPTVVHWRNDAIRQCVSIAYRYCRDPESHAYLKQDLGAMIAAAPQPVAQTVPPLPPAPHKMGDVELWPRSVIDQHVAERTADLEQASRYSADLFQQAKDDWQKDAERYQYIRGNGHYVVQCGGQTLHCGGHVNLNHGAFSSALDKAIDAAMVAQKGQA